MPRLNYTNTLVKQAGVAMNVGVNIEHLNNFTRLESSSHMLKHVLNNHQEQDMKKIKFGMKII